MLPQETGKQGGGDNVDSMPSANGLWIKMDTSYALHYVTNCLRSLLQIISEISNGTHESNKDISISTQRVFCFDKTNENVKAVFLLFHFHWNTVCIHMNNERERYCMHKVKAHSVIASITQLLKSKYTNSFKRVYFHRYQVNVFNKV